MITTQPKSNIGLNESNNMSIRCYINSKKRKYLSLNLTFGIFGVIVAVFTAMCGYPNIAFAIFIIGYMGAWLFYFMHDFKIRCPNCRNRVGHVLPGGKNIFKISDKIHFCPCCRIDLEKDMREIGVHPLS